MQGFGCTGGSFPAGPTGARPRINHQVRKLIQRRAAENPTWGAPRIHGELLKLGLEVSEGTVSGYLAQVGRYGDVGKRWRIFIRNHREAIAGMDFFTVRQGWRIGFSIPAPPRRSPSSVYVACRCLKESLLGETILHLIWSQLPSPNRAFSEKPWTRRSRLPGGKLWE